MFEDAVQSTKRHEGFRSEVYKDSLGLETIGYGFLLAALDPTDLDEAEVIKTRTVSPVAAERILRKKLVRLADKLHEQFDWFDKMPERVQDVILEMCYQLGFGGFMKFQKTMNAMKNRRFKEAKKFMLQSRWAEQTPERASELAGIVGSHGNARSKTT